MMPANGSCIYKAWVASPAQEPDVEVLVSMLTSVEEILGVAGPELLGQERLGQALRELGEVIRNSEERRTERGERTAAEDFDEEEAEALEVPAFHRTSLLLHHPMLARAHLHMHRHTGQGQCWLHSEHTLL